MFSEVVDLETISPNFDENFEEWNVVVVEGKPIWHVDVEVLFPSILTIFPRMFFPINVSRTIFSMKLIQQCTPFDLSFTGPISVFKYCVLFLNITYIYLFEWITLFKFLLKNYQVQQLGSSSKV